MLKLTALAALAGVSLVGLPIPGDKEWKAMLAGRNGSPIEGSAEVEARSADSTKMDVELKKAAASTRSAGEYSVHVHAPSADTAAAGQAVACGDLKPVEK
jgi:hypothetical protein